MFAHVGGYWLENAWGIFLHKWEYSVFNLGGLYKIIKMYYTVHLRFIYFTTCKSYLGGKKNERN